ncbi:MAG: J domain-containing protein [Brevundimonas sp.]|uniref:J domain-containing protein n=1 Tax=Brevundimonas sp. TaxID=1871086 RepID=UPI0027346BF2|nr:J domain-containing protein [Brevundimonas sp.]MDP3657945.1 J domain-containing protein [Brevundimonas sp.]
MSRSIWATLGIKATNDATEIRRAYARRLKEVHPEDDPEGFQALRAAYDRASDMARNGWAVPQPRRPRVVIEGDPDVEAGEAEDWDDGDEDRWHAGPAPFDAGDWAAPTGDRWTRPGDDPAPAGAADDSAWSTPADRARDAELAEAHKALCDQLSGIAGDPAGDRQAALSILIRIFRSPAMDSLSTHGRTERWLAQLIGFGGPAVEDLVEPVIQFFGWNSTRIGLDLSHAQPVLRRRDAADAMRRLEWSGDKDHAAWQALKRKPAWMSRLFERLTPGLPARVSALLQRIAYDLPDLEARMDPRAAALWRARLAQPILSPIFLWIMLLSPPIAALIGNQGGAFGPPDGRTLLALWTVIGVGLFGLGLGYLYGVARPRQAWQSGDPWGRSLWLRLGWAPAALAAPLLAGLIPSGGWAAPLLLLAGLALWGWARVTSSHIPPQGTARFDWGRFAGIAPVFGFVLMQVDLTGPYWIGQCVGFAAAAVVLQAGAEAVADELAHQPRHGRLIAGGQMVVAVAGAAAVLAAAATGVGLALASGLVVAAALADRALAWNRAGSLLTARRLVVMFGWIPGFSVVLGLPYDSFAKQAFVGLGLWLLLASVLTALSGLTEGLDLFSRFRTRPKRKRGPGDLA